jgi:molybdopterin molybdotransferase
MLSVAEARRRVLEAVASLPTEKVNISDALGRVPSETHLAPHDLPRFDNSAMDGYAVRGADAEAASEAVPVKLRVIGEVKAGDAPDLQVERGTAARIMTGAPLPMGADAIVPVEETEEDGHTVIVKAAASRGRHVRPAGDDLSAGSVLVEAGTELGPGEMALLATMGCSPLDVHKIPTVAVLVTGDELVEPETEPGPGQIRDSNSIALRALVAGAGGHALPSPPVADDFDATVAAFEAAAKNADLVLSSGGVAVGRYDFVKAAIEKLGKIDMWRVAMQPGRPVVLGTIKKVPFLGLPGNPVSIHVGFEQFVRPAIRKMRGCKDLLPPTVQATLTEPVEKPPGRLHFVRVRLELSPDGWDASPTGPQGSHIQSSLIECHGVARFEIEETRLEAGSRVTVEVWRLPAGDQG